MSKIKHFDISVKAYRERKKVSKECGGSPGPGKKRKCDWKGCNFPGLYRAPASRSNQNDFYWFCSSHIVEYNNQWVRNSASSTHNNANAWDRPTWSNNATNRLSEKLKMFSNVIFNEGQFWKRQGFDSLEEMIKKSSRKKLVGKKTVNGESKRDKFIKAWQNLSLVEKQSLRILKLSPCSSQEEKQKRYEDLIKSYHPDMNGGNREYEDELRKVLWAWKNIKNM